MLFQMKYIFLLIFCPLIAYTQVKIGSNPKTISPTSLLEVEGTNGQKVVIDNAGRMGIGTVVPTKAIEVLGTAKFDSLYISKGFEAGKVLTSDAFGKATWQTVNNGLSVPVVSTLPATTQDGYLVYLTGNGNGYYFWSVSENTWKRFFSPSVNSTNTGADGSFTVWSKNGTSAYYNGGKVGIGTTTPTEALDVVGNIHFSGDLSNLSDQRMKKNIEAFVDGLSLVKKLKPVRYNYTFEVNGPEKHIGLLAQEVQASIPYLTKNIQKEVGGEMKDLLSLKYNDIILLLVNSVKELSNQNKAINHKNKALAKEIWLLKKKQMAKHHKI